MNVNLSTSYLKLNLRNPLIVAACPLTSELDVLRRIDDLGVGAVVLPSLFQEQIGQQAETENWGGFQGADPQHYRELMQYNRGAESYLAHLGKAKKAVKFPVIASLNGTSPGPWLDYARRIEEAGADALELNLMIPSADPDVTGEEIEERYCEIVAAVREAVRLPLAIKLTPYFTALPHLAVRLGAAGADGLVLFNRWLQPDLNLASRRVVTQVVFSTPQELGMTLRGIGVLRGRVPLSLAATGGVHSGLDMLKAIAVGADAVQVASVIYRQGLDVLARISKEAENWLDEHEYPSIERFKGTLSQMTCSDPAAFARANYTRAISSFVTDPV